MEGVEVGEAGVILKKAELHVVGGTVSLLGDDDGGLALFIGFPVVVILAVEKRDQIGVLLDGARLAKVGEIRAPSLPRLDRPGELAQRHHRDIQLLRQTLEPAGDLADLDLAALEPLAPVGNELEIIDDDEPKALIGQKAAAFRPDVEHGGFGRIVHEDWRL